MVPNAPTRLLTLYSKLTFSKREFWLSDDATTPQHMDIYMRGEKPDVAHPVVAWASQTGKGLLFFNKKGETNRSKPASVIALYDASELKKAQNHEFQFKLHNQQHTFKANSDAERDGWFMTIEKAMELGKASKESVRDSEGYKTEMEKLSMFPRYITPSPPGVSYHFLQDGPGFRVARTTTVLTEHVEPDKPNIMAGNAAVASGTAAKRSQSAPKKSTDVDNVEGAKRAGSASSNSDEDKTKKNKSRSTSRGMLDRLKGKKEEVEAKAETKKEEKADKAENKEEKAEDKAEEKTEEAKADKENEKTDEAAPTAAVDGAALDAPSTAERAMVAPVEEKKDTEATTASPAEQGTADRPKANKRSSIFGSFKQGWGNMKSPAKEKDQKDAELKPSVPPKDAVSETAPQIPEPSTTAASEPTIETPSVAKPTEAGEPSTAEAAKDTTAGTPGKEKSGFLSGFMNKRNRSVSPSAGMKEAPKPAEQNKAAEQTKPVESTPFVTPAEEAAPAEPAATAEPTTTSTEPVVEKSVEKPAEEPKKEERRTSGFLGNISRRASKAFKGTPIADKTSKKENAVPASTEDKVEAEKETPAEAAAETKPTTEGESTIGDVPATSVSTGQPQEKGSAPVAASA